MCPKTVTLNHPKLQNRIAVCLRRMGTVVSVGHKTGMVGHIYPSATCKGGAFFPNVLRFCSFVAKRGESYAAK